VIRLRRIVAVSLANRGDLVIAKIGMTIEERDCFGRR